ncbi:3722_t:CDS:2, partial [Gigaspora rosea]
MVQSQQEDEQKVLQEIVAVDLDQVESVVNDPDIEMELHDQVTVEDSKQVEEIGVEQVEKEKGKMDTRLLISEGIQNETILTRKKRPSVVNTPGHEVDSSQPSASIDHSDDSFTLVKNNKKKMWKHDSSRSKLKELLEGFSDTANACWIRPFFTYSQKVKNGGMMAEDTSSPSLWKINPRSLKDPKIVQEISQELKEYEDSTDWDFCKRHTADATSKISNPEAQSINDPLGSLEYIKGYFESVYRAELVNSSEVEAFT